MLEFIRVILLCLRYRIFSKTVHYFHYRKISIIIPILRFFELLLYPIKLEEKLDFPAAVSSLIQRLGPIYIKFTQTAVSRKDLIREDIANALLLLQDRLPYFDISIVKSIIENDFGSMDEIFVEFSDAPIATASIAQVHKAKLRKNKEEVAVKILKPNVTKEYINNVKLLEFFARLLDRFYSKLKLLEIVNVFKNAMYCELDLSLEAANAYEMSKKCQDNDSVIIPKIYWNLTSKSVMTTQFIDGFSAYDIESVKKHNLNPIFLCRKIAIMFFNQSYGDGFFHADMHPGNIFITSDGKILLLDFGIVGRLSEFDRLGIAEIMFAIISRDYDLVANLHKKMGYINESVDIALFKQRCITVCEPIAEMPLKDILFSKVFEQMIGVCKEFGMDTQPQLLLLQKSMFILEGVCKTLNPNVNMWKLLEPWIKEWARRNLSKKAKLFALLKQIIAKIDIKL